MNLFIFFYFKTHIILELKDVDILRKQASYTKAPLPTFLNLINDTSLHF